MGYIFTYHIVEKIIYPDLLFNYVSFFLLVFPELWASRQLHFPVTFQRNREDRHSTLLHQCILAPRAPLFRLVNHGQHWEIMGNIYGNMNKSGKGLIFLDTIRKLIFDWVWDLKFKLLENGRQREFQDQFGTIFLLQPQHKYVSSYSVDALKFEAAAECW